MCSPCCGKLTEGKQPSLQMITLFRLPFFKIESLIFLKEVDILPG